MKIKLTIMVLIFWAFTANAQIGTRDYLTTNGFNGFHPGDPIEKIPKEKLVPLKTNEQYNIVTYAYTDTNALKLTDKIKLKKITITYGKGRLADITIYFNKEDLEAIKTVFDKLYGEGDKAQYAIADYQNDKADLRLKGKNENGDYVATFGGPDE